LSVNLIEPLQIIVELVDDEDLKEQCKNLSEDAQKSVSKTIQQIIKGDLHTLVSISKTMESKGEKVSFALLEEGAEV